MIDFLQNAGSIFSIDHPVESRLIERMRLDNSLTLNMFDKSRRAAGDRWLVSFEACIEIEVTQEYFSEWCDVNVSFEDVRTLVGERVTYRYEKVRNFVAEAEKDRILRDLKEVFLSASLGYLSNPGFPRGLILRRYHDALSSASGSRRPKSLHDSHRRPSNIRYGVLEK